MKDHEKKFRAPEHLSKDSLPIRLPLRIPTQQPLQHLWYLNFNLNVTILLFYSSLNVFVDDFIFGICKMIFHGIMFSNAIEEVAVGWRRSGSTSTEPKVFCIYTNTHTLNFQHGKVLSISTSGEDKTDYKSTLKLFKCFLDYLQMVWHFHPPVRHAKCPRQFA